MFGLWSRGIRASENFYRNLFALLTFLTFGAALLTNSPVLFLLVLAFGALSRTAVKKGWGNPAFVERVPWLVSKKKS
ncbi:hypothetical protein LJC31_04695 [Synergistaceae bacterium OttesenSCG-928-I11]|nr:hypothetical protein [Synergistaceae bacterium OttesenSCG-928-I11]